MPIKGIAFDLEGTLIDVESAHHEGHLDLAREMGIALSLEEAYTALPHFIGGPDEKVCEEILALADPHLRENTTLASMMKEDRRFYEKRLATTHIALRPGCLEIFETAGKLGLKMAIGSLTSREQAKVLLENTRIVELFGYSNIVLREDVKNGKPAPDVFLRTAEIMSIDPIDQIGFEDSPRGVQALLSAGSKAIAMPVILRPDTIAALTQAGASYVYSNWFDVDLQALIDTLS